jgi:hypothetical protein
MADYAAGEPDLSTFGNGGFPLSIYGNRLYLQALAFGVTHIAFADLPVTPDRDGILYFLTDGVPGRSPAISGGSGAMIISMNGAWVALPDGFTGTGDAVLKTNATLITPTIASFANANHNHTNSAGGGQLSLSAFSSTTGTGAVVGATSPSLVTPNLGVASATSLALGGGTALTKAVVYTPTLTPASVATITCAEQDFTVSGLTTADKVIVNGPAPTAGTGIVNARVKSANTLSLTFVNPTAGSLTPASGIYSIIAIRS